MLTASAQIVGHLELWLRVFARLGLKMDENLINHLKKDNEKGERENKQNIKAYKAIRSANRYSNFAEAHHDQLEDRSRLGQNVKLELQ